MPDWLQRLVLRWFRVPAEPEPPPGDPASLRVFRAAPAYFRYKLILWALGQLGTLIGLAVGLVIGLAFVDDWLGAGILGLLATALGVLAWLGFLAQIPVSYGALRLEYELRWYMLSDRAIRIREGIVRVREQTMTFANIQQISVRQGPLQRFLGIGDVEVRTAGGGESGDGQDMHRGFFRGVADPEGIRDAIRGRVREYRAAGPGGGAGRRERTAAADGVVAPVGPGTFAAARELLEEVRALRRSGLDTQGMTKT